MTAMSYFAQHPEVTFWEMLRQPVNDLSDLMSLMQSEQMLIIIILTANVLNTALMYPMAVASITRTGYNELADILGK